MQRCLNRFIKSYVLYVCMYVRAQVQKTSNGDDMRQRRRASGMHLGGGLPRLGVGGQPSLKSPVVCTQTVGRAFIHHRLLASAHCLAVYDLICLWGCEPATAIAMRASVAHGD
jgi:hypothetical protein